MRADHRDRNLVAAAGRPRRERRLRKALRADAELGVGVEDAANACKAPIAAGGRKQRDAERRCRSCNSVMSSCSCWRAS